LTHLSEYAIGSLLPPDEDKGASPDDTYGACFIESTTPRDSKAAKEWILMALLGVVAVAVLRVIPRHRRRKSFWIILLAMLLSVGFFDFTAHAAEGAAAGAPPAEATEAPSATGVPTPLEEGQPPEMQLRELEKQKDAYEPAAVSSAGKKAPSQAQERDKRFFLHAGVGYAFIGSKASASPEGDGDEITHELDGEFFPILRGSYGFSDHFSLELGFAADFFSGTVKNSLSDGSSDLSGYTFSLAALYYGREYNLRWIGPFRPLILAGAGYRTIQSDLDFPVSGYDPAIGFMVGAGIQKGIMEVRLGYGAYQHDAKDPEEGFTADDKLDTSGVSLEITLRFNIF
jgi:hypothetical protein